MKAYELMAMIAKEPKKYEGKRYKATSQSFYVCGMGKMFSECVINNGAFVSTNSGLILAIAHNTEVEEIKQSVPFMEAIEAYNKGKTIRCEIEGKSETREYIYVPEKICDFGFVLTAKGACAVSSGEILTGTWYIE